MKFAFRSGQRSSCPAHEWRSWENARRALARVPVLSADRTSSTRLWRQIPDCCGRRWTQRRLRKACSLAQCETEDTASVSSLHFLLMTGFSTTGPVPIELVERVEHLVVGLYVARCGTAGAAQGQLPQKHDKILSERARQILQGVQCHLELSNHSLKSDTPTQRVSIPVIIVFDSPVSNFGSPQGVGEKNKYNRRSHHRNHW